MESCRISLRNRQGRHPKRYCRRGRPKLLRNWNYKDKQALIKNQHNTICSMLVRKKKRETSPLTIFLLIKHQLSLTNSKTKPLSGMSSHYYWSRQEQKVEKGWLKQCSNQNRTTQNSDSNKRGMLSLQVKTNLPGALSHSKNSNQETFWIKSETDGMQVS